MNISSYLLNNIFNKYILKKDEIYNFNIEINKIKIVTKKNKFKNNIKFDMYNFKLDNIKNKVDTLYNDILLYNINYQKPIDLIDISDIIINIFKNNYKSICYNYNNVNILTILKNILDTLNKYYIYTQIKNDINNIEKNKNEIILSLKNSSHEILNLKKILNLLICMSINNAEHNSKILIILYERDIISIDKNIYKIIIAVFLKKKLNYNITKIILSFLGFH